MPRARCHWALLVRTRDALREAAPAAHAIAIRHRGEFFAGGIAPDALRLFGGHDKLSTHFYDDQRRETWTQVVETMRAAAPGVADPAALAPATQGWLLGYLAHVLTDIAYWRHVVTALPPFPEHAGVHHGAWVLADQVPIPRDERTLDVDAIRFDAAPPWVQEGPVRRMIERIVQRILSRDGMWPVELGYLRRPPGSSAEPEPSDDDTLAQLLPEWEEHVCQARLVLPEGTWPAFHDDAVRGAVEAIVAYRNWDGGR